MEAAAAQGYSRVVLELIQRVGLRRCAGDGSGANALVYAAKGRHVDTMAVLINGRRSGRHGRGTRRWRQTWQRADCQIPLAAALQQTEESKGRYVDGYTYRIGGRAPLANCVVSVVANKALMARGCSSTLAPTREQSEPRIPSESRLSPKRHP